MIRMISRRNALAVASSSAGAFLVGRRADAATQPGTAKHGAEGPCFLTPQSEEGPFYLDPHLLRSNITEGRSGIPLTLRLLVCDEACAPLRDVRIDVWHADARGVYSGYPGQGDDHALSTERQTFLRGTQTTDDAGLARFATIYPGWYDGRAPHVHVKAFIADRHGSGVHTVLTGQIFFPDALSEYIYTHHPAYMQRASLREIVNRNDHVVSEADPNHLAFASVKEEPASYVASLTLGIDRAAAPKPQGRRPPPMTSRFDMRRGPPRPPHLEDRAKAILPSGPA